MTQIKLFVRSNLNPTSELEGTIVRIYSSNGDTFVTQLVADSEGVVTYDLPDETYWVRFYKQGFSFQSRTLIEVDSDLTNEWTIVGEDLTELPPSGAEGICRVSGFVVDAQGAPTHEAIMIFMLPEEIMVHNRRIISTEKVICQPNKDGYVEVELIQGVYYNLNMHSLTEDVVKVKVPELQSCGITDLIYPTGKIVEALPTTVTLTTGVSKEVPLTLQSSSGIELPDSNLGLSVSSLFSLQPSNLNLTASFSSGGITLSSSTSGSYTLSVYRRTAGNVDVKEKVLLGTISVTVND